MNTPGSWGLEFVAIVPHDPETSELEARITSPDKDLRIRPAQVLNSFLSSQFRRSVTRRSRRGGRQSLKWLCGQLLSTLRTNTLNGPGPGRHCIATQRGAGMLDKSRGAPVGIASMGLFAAQCIR